MQNVDIYQTLLLRIVWDTRLIFNKVLLIWIQGFPSLGLVTSPRLKNPMCPTIYLELGEGRTNRFTMSRMKMSLSREMVLELGRKWLAMTMYKSECYWEIFSLSLYIYIYFLNKSINPYNCICADWIWKAMERSMKR